MAEDHIRYDILTQNALREVVRKVLDEAAKTGLPGEHHFFISFATRAPGVRISERLLEKWPDEMTIGLQHQFWDLEVSDTGFQVGLAFDGINELLIIPFSAMKGFFDPSVQFGLQFEVKEGPTDIEKNKDSAKPAEIKELAPSELVAKSEERKPVVADPIEPDENDDSASDEPAEKVVSLDAFRKKT